MKTRVYIAAPLGRASDANDFADMLLVADGYEIVSRWHRTVKAGEVDPSDPEACAVLHEANKLDIRRADLMVVVRPAGGKTTYVEAGIAEERGVPVLWFCPGGEGRCLASRHVVESLDRFFPKLRALSERWAA